jgi:hypothetical protein
LGVGAGISGAGTGGAGAFSGAAFSSSISVGRDTPILVFDDPVFGAAIGAALPSNPVEYVFDLVHRSHQSPTVSYQSFEFCGFNIQCPSSGK